MRNIYLMLLRSTEFLCLNSERAIQVNIQIMRTFNRLRELIIEHQDLREEIESLEKKYDYQFKQKIIRPADKPQSLHRLSTPGINF